MNGLMLWAAFGASIAIIQYNLQHASGGLTPLFNNYGAMYGEIKAGDFWRLLTGPYFHYSAAHYLINIFMLAIIGPLAWSLFKYRCVFVFVVGNFAGLIIQMECGSQDYDNAGGISFGIYAMLGLLIAESFFNKRLLPHGLGLFCFGLSISGVLITEVMSDSAATAGHVGGFLVGTLCSPSAFRSYRSEVGDGE